MLMIQSLKNSTWIAGLYPIITAHYVINSVESTPSNTNLIRMRVG